MEIGKSQRQNPSKYDGVGSGVAKGDIRFSINATTADYLQWLSKNTTLGKTANEVARQVLISRLSEMRGEEFKPPEKS